MGRSYSNPSVIADSVDTDAIVDGAVTIAKIADGAVNAAKIAAGAVGAAALADNAVDEAAIVDGAVTGAKLGPDAVNGSKIADDAVDSEHVVDGAIDRAHLAADIVDGTKLADDAVDSEHIVDGAIDRAHLAADIVDGTKLADDAVDSEHIVDGAVGTAALADGGVTGAKLAAGAVEDLSVLSDLTKQQILGLGRPRGSYMTVVDCSAITGDGLFAGIAASITAASQSASAGALLPLRKLGTSAVASNTARVLSPSTIVADQSSFSALLWIESGTDLGNDDTRIAAGFLATNTANQLNEGGNGVMIYTKPFSANFWLGGALAQDLGVARAQAAGQYWLKIDISRQGTTVTWRLRAWDTTGTQLSDTSGTRACPTAPGACYPGAIVQTKNAAIKQFGVTSMEIAVGAP